MVVRKQSDAAQKGEVEFRKKVIEQEVGGGASYMDGTFTAEETESYLLRLIEETVEDIGVLASKGIPLSPYLEIGADRGHRSLVMENDFQATGIATDLSYHYLSNAGHYAKLLNKSKLPMRVCGDAYHLPFLSNSLAFVFTYATLHHFPDPSPIVAEIHRVLAPGGCFFVDDEPSKVALHVNLFSVRKTHHDQTRPVGRLERVLHRHFARRVAIEEDYSIIENDRIPLSVWSSAMKVFSRREAMAITLRGKQVPLDWRANPLGYLTAHLCGANISGCCWKAGELPNSFAPINEILACPTCLEAGTESRLEVRESTSTCAKCGRHYPVVDGVVVALPGGMMESLYPDLVAQQ
jgi:SAM-dependent methyltransferase/uncharacterized protein YbaR (Trm112 family)